MCVIAVKDKGVKMPDQATIDAMWTHNPDGAGFMYAKDGKVYIEKGFMTLNSLKKALDTLGEREDLTSLPMVLLFMIGTAGGNTPANTHPFPISSKLEDLQAKFITADVAMAHNGVLDVIPTRKDISDTMEFVMSDLAWLNEDLPEFWKRDSVQYLLEDLIGHNKLAFLDKHGDIVMIGKFISDHGIYYSNESFKNTYIKWTYSSYPYSYGYDWDDDDDDLDYYGTRYLGTGKSASESASAFTDTFEFDLGMDDRGNFYLIDWNTSTAAYIYTSLSGFTGNGSELTYDPNNTALIDITSECVDLDELHQQKKDGGSQLTMDPKKLKPSNRTSDNAAHIMLSVPSRDECKDAV